MVGILEYRNGTSLLSGEAYLNPIAGVLATTVGSVYGYAGLRLGFPYSSPWHWENAAGVGAYSKGNGPDLYSPFEFFLAFTLTRQITERTRVGIQAFHISNASLQDQNPGSDSFLALIELGI